MNTPSEQPDFWNVRYRSGRTPWDQGGVPAALARYLFSHPGEGSRVLIPGCGSGYEIAAFARAGLPPALAERVHHGDFFTHDFAHAPFDLVYERTFLCALPPGMWPRLVSRTGDLIASGGILAGFYFFGEKVDGPPFGLEPPEPATLFDARFLLVADHPVPSGESLPLFAGRERWQERRKRVSLAG
jgi:hypothetical protein